MKRFSFWYVILLVLILTLVGMIESWYSSARTYYYPNSGIWYCDELQAQLCFDENYDFYYEYLDEDLPIKTADDDYYRSFIVKDNVKIRCDTRTRRGNKYVFLYYYDPILATSDMPRYSIDDCLFIGLFLSSTKSTLTLKDDDTGHVYTFHRTD